MKIIDTKPYLLARTVIYMGLGLLDRILGQKNNLFILCYHAVGDDNWRYSISKKVIEKQMKYLLKKSYQPVHLSDIEDHIRERKILTKPSFAVTFDDGYRDIIQLINLFKELEIHPTVFVLSNPEKANRVELDNNRPFLTKNQIKTLKSSGWDIENHTATHGYLPFAENLEEEIYSSKQLLSSKFNIKAKYLAYPKGGYNSKVIKIVKDSGYSMALSMDGGTINQQTNIFAVPRIGVDRTHSFKEFKFLSSPSIMKFRIFSMSAFDLIGKLKHMKKTKRIPIKKNIHIVARCFYPVTSGMEINMLETHSELKRQGWNVHVFTTRNSHTEKNIFQPEETYKGLKIHRFDTISYQLLRLRRKNIIPSEGGILCLHSLEILPHYIIYAKVLLLKLMRKKRFAVVYTSHGLFDLSSSGVNNLKIIIKSIIDLTLGVFLINHTVDKVRAVSNWEKNFLIKKGIRKELISVITNGIELDAYKDLEAMASDDIKKSVNNLGRYIIQLARIEQIKNQEIVIRAMTKLPKDVKFVIAGPVHGKKYDTFLRNLVNSLNLQDRVIFFGTVKGIDKYYLLKKSQMMVHMSKLEGFCNSIHEAMSQGLPCIASRNTAVEDLIKDGVNGFLSGADDSLELAKKINFILDKKNVEKVNNMRVINRLQTRGDTWKQVATKVNALYSSIKINQ